MTLNAQTVLSACMSPSCGIIQTTQLSLPKIHCTCIHFGHPKLHMHTKCGLLGVEDSWKAIPNMSQASHRILITT